MRKRKQLERTILNHIKGTEFAYQLPSEKENDSLALLLFFLSSTYYIVPTCTTILHAAVISTRYGIILMMRDGMLRYVHVS